MSRRRASQVINIVELEIAGRMPAMRVINRTAISIVGAQPYVDWTRRMMRMPPKAC